MITSNTINWTRVSTCYIFLHYTILVVSSVVSRNTVPNCSKEEFD